MFWKSLNTQKAFDNIKQEKKKKNRSLTSSEVEGFENRNTFS